MSDKALAIQADETTVVPFDMSRADGLSALKQAETVVGYMSAKCAGPSFISSIQGKRYPLVTWWTTVGAALGLFPQEVSSKRLDGEPMTYEAVVEVRHGEQVVSRASAICSKSERSWANRDEYAVKSMATTRATGKAYRIAFAFLAVLAGLEPTPAEEMPVEIEPPKREVRPQDQEEVLREIGNIVRGSKLDEASKDRWRKEIAHARTLEALVAIKEQIQREAEALAEMDSAAEEGFGK